MATGADGKRPRGIKAAPAAAALPSDGAVVEAALLESERLRRYLGTQIPLLAEVADVLANAIGSRRKIVLFGNGGSAADAQHLAAEFVGRFTDDRQAWPAMALTVNTSAMTAIANDYGYDHVFARQVEALVDPGDVTIGITTSGDSLNVIRGLQAARRRGAITVALTGRGGAAAELADIVLRVPSDDTPRIQEIHIAVGHLLCGLVEKRLTQGPAPAGARRARSRRATKRPARV